MKSIVDIFGNFTTTKFLIAGTGYVTNCSCLLNTVFGATKMRSAAAEADVSTSPKALDSSLKLGRYALPKQIGLVLKQRRDYRRLRQAALLNDGNLSPIRSEYQSDVKHQR